MTPSSPSPHSLVVYKPGERADAALLRLCDAARAQGGRVTVLALATEERPSSRCCDTRAVLWNRICREIANEDLTRAAQVLNGHADVDFDALVARAGRAADALGDQAVARRADEIVLADLRRSGLGRRELRRLRRNSRVPVRD